MAKDVMGAGRHAADVDGAGLRLAIVCGRFNDHITLRLLAGAERQLASLGVDPGDWTVDWVPGAFEIPLAAQTHAASGGVDAVVTLGCVIRGETTHYEIVSAECASGVQQAQLATGVPICFGVLTTEDLDQALARSEGSDGHNVGADAAAAAVEMARLVSRTRGS